MATNYDAIKNMSQPEMAAVFYLFVKPVLDALNASEEDKKKARENIKAFLATEVKGKHESSK